MKLAIMQPYVFPYIGYFQLIASVDKFIFYDDVNFIKKGWIHRNNILVNGNSKLFTIPCKKVSQNKLINEIELSFDKKEKERFLKTIEFAYKKAPFYNEIYKLICEIIYKIKSENIADLAINSIELVSGYLAIPTQFQRSSLTHPDSFGLEKQQRLISICNKESADTYINPIGGLALYKKEDFKKFNIQLSFIKSNPITYKQFSNVFTPNLSIIDILMFNDVGTINKYLNSYKLI